MEVEPESSPGLAVPEAVLDPMVLLPMALEALESEVPSVPAVLVPEVLDALELVPEVLDAWEAQEHQMAMASVLPEHRRVTALV